MLYQSTIIGTLKVKDRLLNYGETILIEDSDLTEDSVVRQAVITKMLVPSFTND